MTRLPERPTPKRLGLAIDLDTCVGCHACVISCKEWNTSGYAGPLGDSDPYGAEPLGVFLNRVHSYEVRDDATGQCRTSYFPKSCLHCDDAPCVTVCPTGASLKRADDGIVLVDEDKCIGCGLCAWACPYGAREMDPLDKVMKKCTLCVDRIHDEALPIERREPACVSACPVSARHFGDFNDPDSTVSRLTRERGGFDLMPEQGCRPTNQYLPPRPRHDRLPSEPERDDDPQFDGFLGWLDKALGG